MKFTQSFKITQTRPDSCSIKAQWIEATVNSPDTQTIQTDGRIHRWNYADL